MRRRFTHDADVGAAMTGHTACRNPLVAHRPCRKGRRALMACLTPGGGWDVSRRRFAHDPSGCAIVTAPGRAACCDPRVIECGPGK